ncbi:MAG: hypothetical protein KGQ36_00585 [Rickettsiales bacterium]|nr:hypothetical protein [Rickettsiales bacterium]
MKELTALSEVEIGKLSNQELCDRMDAILYRILCESYSNQSAVESFSRQNMKDFFNSKEIQLLPEKHQRNALKKCFEYLVQLEYEARIGGWVNQEIYNANYNENTSWLNTKTHIINCTANQIKITSSSIAWEKMRDLLYSIEN